MLTLLCSEVHPVKDELYQKWSKKGIADRHSRMVLQD